MHDLEKIEKLSCKELDKLMEEGKMNPSVAEYAQLLTDIVKNVKKIEMLDEGGEDDYSERSYRDGYDRRRSGRSSIYDDYSGARRDSRGRYSREGGRDHMIATIGGLMEDANTEEERRIIEDTLRKLRK